MSQYSDEPRFTIEQIDLLQRLRRTGLTKPEILQALDTLERLDLQHGHKFPPHRALPPGPADPASSSSPSSNSVTAASSSTTSTATQTSYRGNNGLQLPSPANSYSHASSPPPPPPQCPIPTAAAVTAAAVVAAAAAQNGRGEDGMVAMTNGKLSPPQFPVSVSAVSGSGSSRGYGFEPSEEDMDIEDKVEELMRRDSAIIKEEIKAFLGTRRISQAVVAQVTGISQSRISHWLLQQGSDLSEQKKRAFYRWYQLEKTTPGNTAPIHPHHPQPHAPAATPQDSSSASPHPEPPSPPSLHSVQSLFSCSTRSIHY